MKRDAAGTFSFTGELATDNVVIDIDTETGGHNWHSIGNPYPSYLPGNNPAVTTNNVLSSNQNNLDPNYVALYIWIDGQHIPVNQLSESFYLAPGQGFLIHSMLLFLLQFYSVSVVQIFQKQRPERLQTSQAPSILPMVWKATSCELGVNRSMF